MSVAVQVKPHTKMSRIMNAYADKKSYEVNQIRFLYDGKRLAAEMTPEELEMEDGDVIDAVLVGACQLPCAASSSDRPCMNQALLDGC